MPARAFGCDHDPASRRQPDHDQAGGDDRFVAVCWAVFLRQFSLPPADQARFVYGFGFVPGVLFGDGSLPRPTTPVPPISSIETAMFLHGGWLHLLGNMLYLWIFGNNVEDSMGHGGFVVFYVLCGAAAAMAQAAPHPGSAIPMIGASGASSGILGAYLLLYPHARVLVLNSARILHPIDPGEGGLRSRSLVRPPDFQFGCVKRGDGRRRLLGARGRVRRQRGPDRRLPKARISASRGQARVFAAHQPQRSGAPPGPWG